MSTITADIRGILDEQRTAVAREAETASRQPAIRPVLVRLADVKPEAVTWIWPGRLAAGKLAILCGDPGLGKSWITLDVAARLSSGRDWPDGAAGTAPANALVLSAEDGLADTIRPRLDALGADVSRVHYLAVVRCAVKEHTSERSIRLSDAGAVEDAICETGARLVIIDPVSAYLGSADSHRDAEVRGLMAPLAAVAERTGAAILGVMHLAKSAQRPAIHRAVGSIAFAAAARTVLAVAADPNREGRRFLAPVKANLSAAPPVLAYTLTEGRLTWEADAVSDVDVEALLSGPTPARPARRQADTWLRDVLAAGPVQVRELKSAVRAAGLAWRTVEEAKHRLGVETDRVGYGASGRWYWRLPDATQAAPKAASGDAPAVYDDEPEELAHFQRSAPKAAMPRDAAAYDADYETAFCRAARTAERAEVARMALAFRG